MWIFQRSAEATCHAALPLHRRMSGDALVPIDYNMCILSPSLHNSVLHAEQPRLLTPEQVALAYALGYPRASMHFRRNRSGHSMPTDLRCPLRIHGAHNYAHNYHRAA